MELLQHWKGEVGDGFTYSMELACWFALKYPPASATVCLPAAAMKKAQTSY